MTRIILFICLTIFTAACSVSPENNSGLVEQYMKLAGVDEILTQYSYAYTTEAKRLYKHIPNSFWKSTEYLKVIDEYEKELWTEWKSVYDEKLTETELMQLIEFLNTDLGKKFLNIQKEVQPVFTDVSIRAGGRLNDKFGVIIKNYESR